MKSKGTILVIDDSNTIRTVITGFLENSGYTVHSATTHEEALTILNNEKIDLVTLDWGMPGIVGLDFVRELRGGWKYFDVPIVIMTGRNSYEDIILAMNMGCDDFVCKEDGTDMLEIRIRRLLSFLKRLDIQESRRDTRHILLVDDSATFLGITQAYLKDLKFEVSTANSGSQALKRLNETTIDLMIVDWMMPEMNGLELIRAVRENDHYREIPIIMLSGRDALEDIIAAIESGADDFINKDSDLKLLEKKIGVLLRIQEQYRRYTRQIIRDKNRVEELVVKRTMELKETQSQLFQAEKMASLGQMVAGMAHEVNNPLSFVHNNFYMFRKDIGDILELIGKYRNSRDALKSHDGFEDILQFEDDIDLDSTSSELYELIQSSENGINRIKDLVLTLRNFARLDEGEKKYADILEGIESTLLILNHRMKSRIAVVKDFEALPKIFCSPGQLNQVFMNIIDNAIQAIEGKGTITIKGRADDKTIVLKFHDTGKGIAFEHMGHIFDPFFTTQPVGEGTGIGLSICYSIIEAHKGKITVKSLPGDTTFTVEIPIQ